MGICDFPRIHFKGLLDINVGTANNDDYSSDVFPPGHPFAGEPLRLADSIAVQANRFDMTDEEWVAWAQAKGQFCPQASVTVESKSELLPRALVDRAATVELIPGEWNYYGDMGLTMKDVMVLSTQTSINAPPDTTDSMVGATLSFNNRPGTTGRSTGMMIDANPESVPCTQIFTDMMTLEKDGEALLNAKPSKACTRWINFQRNTNLGGPNGAAGTFYCAIPLSAIEGQPIATFMKSVAPPQGKVLGGIQVRYVMYRAFQPINIYKYPGESWADEMLKLYATQGMNPDISDFQGTIAPWYEDEMMSSPSGRVLNPVGAGYKIPEGSIGNTGTDTFQLAPAMLYVDQDGGRVSIDCATTFADAYAGTDYDPLITGNNPKYDLGEVHLVLRDTNAGTSHDFGPIPYTDTEAGDRCGWIFDFPTAGVSVELLAEGDFFITSEKWNDLLQEAEYFIASDQSCIYGEQGLAGSSIQEYMNEGPDPVPASVRVFRKGVELAGTAAPQMSLWSYDTTPNQVAGARELISSSFKPGDSIAAPATSPGNRLFTFTLAGQDDPPATTDGLNLMTLPQVNLRILPNDIDYSQYYRDASADQPIGNDSLTFDVIYELVLRNYYLLYPGMSLRIPLNDPEQWSGAEMAGRLMQRTQKNWFDKAEYMPRTRDLSDSRRVLLHAWCLKFLVSASAVEVSS